MATKRNSENTKQRIIDAAMRLLSEGGFASFGVNSVAREAGVDKVLIYRYFGGLPELLREIAGRSEFWPDAEEIIGVGRDEIASLDLRRIAAMIIKGRMRELRKRPLTQEIMRWEMIEKNDLTEELHKEREKKGWELFNMLPVSFSIPEEMDLEAIAALAIAGATYLVLRSKTAGTFQGVSLHTEEGWRRFEKAIDTLVDAYFSYFEK